MVTRGGAVYRRIKGVSRVCQGCVKGVSRGLSRVCQGCVKGVSRVCHRCEGLVMS